MTKDEYPYSLDAPLIEAIKLAFRHNDQGRARQLWDVFLSYRSADFPNRKLEETFLNAVSKA